MTTRRRTSRLRATGAGILALALLTLTGCGGSTEPDPTAAVQTSSASVPSETPTTMTVEGERLRGLSDFPVAVTPDPTWTPSEPGPGTLSFRDADGINAISVHAVSSLASTPQDQVPEDVVAFLQEKRTDIVVTDVASVTQSGLPAQRFRITMSPGRSPSDLWKAVSGSGYKPLPTDPLEVVAVRSSEGLVFLWTEWAPPNQAAALAAFDAALPTVRIW